MKRLLTEGSLQGHVLASTSDTGVYSCIIKCHERSDCLSINYQHQRQTCELNRATLQDFPGHFVNEAGFWYVSYSECNDLQPLKLEQRVSISNVAILFYIVVVYIPIGTITYIRQFREKLKKLKHTPAELLLFEMGGGVGRNL